MKNFYNLLTIIFVLCAFMALGGVEYGMFSWLRAFAQAGLFTWLAYLSAQAEKRERRKARVRK